MDLLDNMSGNFSSDRYSEVSVPARFNHRFVLSELRGMSAGGGFQVNMQPHLIMSMIAKCLLRKK